MRQNPFIRYSSRISAKTIICKTLLLSFWTLFSATAHADVCPKNNSYVLKKVRLQGDHINGNLLTCIYADFIQEEIIITEGQKPRENSLEITPINLDFWLTEEDALVCTASPNNRCEFIYKNKPPVHFPDQCGNYSLAEAWERYYKLADELEYTVDDTLSEKFEQAGMCFNLSNEMCKWDTSAHCTM